MKPIAIILAYLFAGALLHAQEVDTLHLSTLYTTHVVFRSDLVYADLSNTRLVAAKIVDQNRTMLALKAREPFEVPSSVSALESDGTIHTFVVAYREHPDRLVVDMRGNCQQKSGTTLEKVQERSFEKPSQRIFHIGQREYGLQLLCEDLYVRDDNTCFVLSLKNGGGVSYEAGDATFVIESRKKGKRSIQYERNLYPKERSGSLSASPGSTSRILYRFDKVTLTKDQVLKVYVYETGGQRHLVLTVNHYDINRARRK